MGQPTMVNVTAISMSTKQTHYQTNRRALRFFGNLMFWGGSFCLIGVRSFILTLSRDVIASLPFPVLATLSLASPLLLMAVIVGGFLLSMTTTKIVTSPEGIEFHQFGFYATSPWSNVARIAAFQAGNLSAPALYFDQPAPQFFTLFPSQRVGLIKIIPLQPFQIDADSPLGEALRSYRPDLFA